MSDNDKWAWFSEEDPIASLLRPESTGAKADPFNFKLDPIAADAPKSPAGSASLGRALLLHVEGKSEEALKELAAAAEQGDHVAELCAAMGHIQFELGKFEEAAKSYSKVLSADSKHKTAYYNLGVCQERQSRFE